MEIQVRKEAQEEEGEEEEEEEEESCRSRRRPPRIPGKHHWRRYGSIGR